MMGCYDNTDSPMSLFPQPSSPKIPEHLGACLACGRSIATCVRLVEKSDRGCCKKCAHP